MKPWVQNLPPFYKHIVGCKYSYMGIRSLKNPMDAWAYQEIIWSLRPTLIIECGTYCGASAMMLIQLMINFDVPSPRVVTIDVDPNWARDVHHPFITKLIGESTSKDIVGIVEDIIKPTDRVMVILDSDHSEENVLAELEQYAQYVSEEQFLIVEDGDAVPGPWNALQKWVPEHPEFLSTNVFDEKLVFTSNPGGYLLRKKD